MARPLCLIDAPAGFGKTYLAAGLYRRLPAEGVRTAWLVPRAYSNASAFAAELAVAIDPDGRPSADDLEATAVALAGCDTRTAVFIDGCDGCLGESEMGLLQQLFESVGEQVCFVLLSRRRNSFPGLADLDLRGAVARIGWQHLAFCYDETTALMPPGTEPEILRQLQVFTEGWPALLRSAALVLESKQSYARDAQALTGFFAGTDPVMRDYVHNHVVATLAPFVATAFEAAGVVDTVNAGLLAALVDMPATNALFTPELDDAEPFLRGVDGRPGWFGFHPAIVAMARSEFAVLPEKVRSERHMRAARWFSSQDHLEEAVHHAVETGDYSMAEACIREAGSVRIFLRSGYPTLRRLMEQLPVGVILQSSALQLCQAVVFGKQGQLGTARDLIDDVRKALSDGHHSVDVLHEDVLHIDSLVSVYEDTVSDPDIVALMEREARALSPRELWQIGWVANHLCIAHTNLGDFEAAEAEALRALNCYREQKVSYAQVFILMHLSLVAISKGNPAGAEVFVRQARKLADSTQRGDPYLRAILDVPMAELHHIAGELEAAERLLDTAIPTLVAGEAWVDLFERAFLIRARIAIAKRDTAAAMRTADTAEQTASQRRLSRLALFAGQLRAEIMARSGLSEAAEELAGKYAWVADMQWTPGEVQRHGETKYSWREWHLGLATLARVRWAQNRGQEAVDLLERLCRSALAIGAGHDLAAARALQCCYLWHMKRPENARASFQLAVALATPQRMVSVFADEGYPMSVAIRGILRRFGAAAFSHATIQFANAVLCTHLRNDIVIDDYSGGSRIEILLTDHEREILEHLVRGLSNKQIALEISRTEATVKYHLRRIYAKFGVKSRTMAIVVAKNASIVG